MFQALNVVALVLSLMAASCSRVLVADDPPEVASDGDETDTVGGAGPSSVGGAGGAGPDDPPPTPLVDTGTLSVAVSIGAGNREASEMGQAELARVGLSVTVTERATGLPVNNAEVRGGPPGSLVPLPYNVYSLSSYATELTGYAPVWELSIVRGSDRIDGLLLESPSYPSASAAIEATSGLIAWAPATELGVTARVCATTTNAAPPYTAFSQLCVDTVDSGALALDSEARNEMFPFPGTYWVVVERFLNQPTSTGDERTVSVFASMELAL